MHAPGGHSRSRPSARALSLIAIFCGCMLHRALVLAQVWPDVRDALHALPDVNIMQHLPTAVWRDHFWAGLWYLQQTPPVANVVFGVLSKLLDSRESLSLGLFWTQALLASGACTLLAGLLMRLHLPLWAAISWPAVLFLSGDLIALEYASMGQYLYEQIAMLLAVVATHAALSLQRSGQARAAVGLGVCVALLALTRSTYSYFGFAVLGWLLWIPLAGRKRLLAAYAIPLLLLHGSWSLKNQFVYGYFSVATTSWGGALMRAGDSRRHGGEHLIEWMKTVDPLCEPSAWELNLHYPRQIFLFPNIDRFMAFRFPESVTATDLAVARARGRMVFYDTEAVRYYSHCLQRIYSRYWMSHPLETLRESAKSYGVFWLPIREFAVMFRNPIAPRETQQGKRPAPGQWLGSAFSELGGAGYQIGVYDISTTPPGIELRNVPLAVLPALPLLAHFANFALVHLLPVALALRWWRRRELAPDWPTLAFMGLLLAYIAGVSSLAEYGENMRFRLVVEPIVWALSAVAVSVLLRRERPQQPSR